MPRPLLPCADLATTPHKSRVTVAGLVITRQRPGTASGVIFLTLEDETGIANVIVWPKTYERHRRAVIGGRLLRVTGELQREGAVTHLIAGKIESLGHLLDRLGLPEDPRSDEARRPVGGSRSPVDAGSSSRPDHSAGAPAGPMKTALAPRRRSGARHPRDQAKQLFPSRDFH
ncbi:MAG TPA: OB-fold nucleic acid binding domain-containing protein [Thermohalobaculum sp.]|nr:OB-fold nucleic acid binding domain-containing protein [Thermohalobaculum sp.]